MQKLAAFWPQVVMLGAGTGLSEAIYYVGARPSLIILVVAISLVTVATTFAKAIIISEDGWEKAIHGVECRNCQHLKECLAETRKALLELKL
jgi:hypothetical protein